MPRAGLEGDLRHPAEIPARAHHDAGLGVADEIFDLGGLVGGIQRQVDVAGAQHREVEQQRLDRLLGLHRHARARRQPERIEQVGDHRRGALDVAPGVEETARRGRRRSRWRCRRARRESPRAGRRTGSGSRAWESSGRVSPLEARRSLLDEGADAFAVFLAGRVGVVRKALGLARPAAGELAQRALVDARGLRRGCPSPWRAPARATSASGSTACTRPWCCAATALNRRASSSISRSTASGTTRHHHLQFERRHRKPSRAIGAPKRLPSPHAQVAAGRDLQPAADAVALDLRDQRDVAGEHGVQRRRHHVLVEVAQRGFLEAELGELDDVAAGREMPAGAAPPPRAAPRQGGSACRCSISACSSRHIAMSMALSLAGLASVRRATPSAPCSSVIEPGMGAGSIQLRAGGLHHLGPALPSLPTNLPKSAP